MEQMNKQSPMQNAEAAKWLRRYTSARVNFLIIFVLTLLNIVLRLTDGGIYFPFSAAMPDLFVDVAIQLGGGSARIAVAVVFALVLAVFYLLAFLFTKKPSLGWMIAALPVMVVDLLILLFSYEIVSVLIDLAFHIYIIVAQVLGLIATVRVSGMPEMPAGDGTLNSFVEVTGTESVPSDAPNSPVLRAADMSVRAKELLSVEVNGHSVLYRRVKRTNELVIDGNVYGEYTALAEMPHELCAVIDGHVYAVGLVSGLVGKSYAAVDGTVVAQKTRWI